MRILITKDGILEKPFTQEELFDILNTDLAETLTPSDEEARLAELEIFLITKLSEWGIL